MLKKSLEDFSVKNQRALVRCDFNVPVQDGVITDPARIDASLPTLRYLLEAGAKVIVMSHFGRPKGEPKKEYSLSFVAEYLKKALPYPVKFADDDRVTGETAAALAGSLVSGELLLLQNTRFRKEEEKNAASFSRELAAFGDLFINDAFGTAHRAHCSTAGVADYLPSGLGYLLKREVEVLGGVLENPKRPFVAILGGSKVSDKIGVIENLLDKVDTLIIGGAMMFTFYRAMGLQTGNSMVEEDKVSLAAEILARGKEKGVEILLPQDVVLADRFADDATIKTVKQDGIEGGWMGLDIGPESVETFKKSILGAQTVIWNGPMGVFEMPSFNKGTFGVAAAMAECKGTTVIGGGDSAAAVELAGLASEMSHISTGGGASLEFLEGKALPGIAVLDDTVRVPFICGNWKMNTTVSQGRSLLEGIMAGVKDQAVKVAVCPPFTHLQEYKKSLKGSLVKIGAQNVNAAEKGAFTGEISISMLKDLGMDYCIVGHSERRELYGETDQGVNQKTLALLAEGIAPIVCCGESLEIREQGGEKEHVLRQIKAAFQGIPSNWARRAVVAYEPIWAIGTGRTASVEQAEEMCGMIRSSLLEMGLPGNSMAILYGGSVNDANAKDLMSSANIDGALVGGASLKAEAFLKIISDSRP